MFAGFRILAATIFILLPLGNVFGQLTFDVDPRNITVGDPFELTITVNVNEDGIVVWPSQDQLAPAEILNIDTLASTGRERSIRYSLSIFEPGDADLPDQAIIVSYPDGADTLRFDPGIVEVESILEGADSLADIRDIRPPVKLRWLFKDLLPYLLGLSAILIICALVYILWKRYKRSKGELPLWEPPPLPPDEIALRKLQELADKKLWQNGYFKDFYSELTDIVKEYIGGRYEIIAPEMTTEELLKCRGTTWKPPDEPFRNLRRILTSADLVKFARFKPAFEECKHNLDVAFTFIFDTRVKFAATVEEA